MVKAVRELKKILHITFIAGIIRLLHKIVNSSIENVKKVFFFKSPERIARFREMNLELPWPPEPVITR